MGRLDRVTVATSRGDVDLPWASRDALLEKLRDLDSAKPIVGAFEAVGASRPVELTSLEEGKLVAVINECARELDATNLPAGVWELRCAIVY